MKKVCIFVACAAILGAALCLCSCRENNSSEYGTTVPGTTASPGNNVTERTTGSLREELSDKVTEMSEKASEKIEDASDKVSEKLEDASEEVSEGAEDLSEMISDKAEDLSEMISERNEDATVR